MVACICIMVVCTIRYVHGAWLYSMLCVRRVVPCYAGVRRARMCDNELYKPRTHNKNSVVADETQLNLTLMSLIMTAVSRDLARDMHA